MAEKLMWVSVPTKNGVYQVREDGVVRNVLAGVYTQPNSERTGDEKMIVMLGHSSHPGPLRALEGVEYLGPLTAIVNPIS
jgi:hypothetical protein